MEASETLNLLIVSASPEDAERLKILRYLQSSFDDSEAFLVQHAPKEVLECILGKAPKQLLRQLPLGEDDVLELLATLKRESSPEMALNSVLQQLNESLRNIRVRVVQSNSYQEVQLPEDAIVPLEQLKREAYEHALRMTNGDIKLAAQRLGVAVSSMYRQLKAYGMSAESYRKPTQRSL